MDLYRCGTFAAASLSLGTRGVSEPAMLRWPRPSTAKIAVFCPVIAAFGGDVSAGIGFAGGALVHSSVPLERRRICRGVHDDVLGSLAAFFFLTAVMVTATALLGLVLT